MKQLCKKMYLSPRLCRNELSTIVTVRQLALESSIRHGQGLWILIFNYDKCVTFNLIAFIY